MIKSLKNQKGAISLFAVLSIMFFIAFMIGAYRIVSANNGMQITSLTTIKERYMKTDEDVKKDYSKIVSSDKRIPISSYEDFKQIGTKNSIIYNGKVYYCGNDNNYTYYFTNDIAFDLDREYDTNSGKVLTAKGNFIPPSVKLQTHLADSETTYKIEPGQFDIIYYKNNEKYKLLVFQNGSYTKIDKEADIADETNNKEYYGALKSYSDIVGSDKDKYKSSDGKYNYLLMYNIPNVSNLVSLARNSFGMTDLTIPIENHGFFSQGLYVKWEQTNTILNDSATGVKINTEGDPSKGAGFEAINMNGMGFNPIKISQIHFPSSTAYSYTAFRGLRYNNTSNNLMNSGNDNYPVGGTVLNDKEHITLYGDITFFGIRLWPGMTATKAMLFAKIYDK